MTIKSLLTRNNSMTLKPGKWSLSDQQEGAILERHSESSFASPTNLKEIEEGMRIFSTVVQRIRPWSHEGWAILNCLSDVSYFWSIADNEAEAVKMCSKLINLILAKNCARASQGSYPYTYAVRLKLYCL